MNVVGGPQDDRDRIERAYYSLMAERWGVQFSQAKSLIEFNNMMLENGLKQLRAGELKGR